ncbi:MAG: F420-0--gamma-glutamyl ligase, partial [Acidobacteria bacterium]|nr:F420-0--gamma-glutamyl ligase [Acidobacteriota bacterium]
MTDSIQLIPITGIGEIRPGDNLAQSIIEAARRIGLNFEPHDIFIVAQKIVSKSEGRLVDLGTVEPTPRAIEIARLQERDPRLVEAILGESASLLRIDRHVLITETHHGFICANAGVDRSNVVGEDWISLLPVNPDRSAQLLSEELRNLLCLDGAPPPVIITDT